MRSGSEQFNNWIIRRFPGGATNEEIASELGMDQSLVTKLRKGTRGVGLTFAHRIYQVTGIPMHAWLSDSCEETETGAPRNPRKSLKDKVSKAHANG
jgi:transcriptional regulator with XRE-family HTH domain